MQNTYNYHCINTVNTSIDVWNYNIYSTISGAILVYSSKTLKLYTYLMLQMVDYLLSLNNTF